jgi:hypothetical protein
MYRQGDVLIKPLSVLPEGIELQSSSVLVYGESTGHAHRIEKGSVYKTKSGDMFLDVKRKTRIVHEEHKPIELPAGKYAVIRQREYVNADMVKIVVD